MHHNKTKFTLPEVALLSGESTREVSRAIHAGLLRVDRKGRVVRVFLDDLKTYLKIDEQAELAAMQTLPLLDLLPGLPPGCEARVFLAKVAQILQKGLDDTAFADATAKAVVEAIAILTGTDRYLGDRVEVVGFNEDWGTFRILAGAPAFGLLVTGRNQEAVKTPWPGPAVCFKGFEFDEINPNAFEAMAQLIDGVINSPGTDILGGQLWTSPASRANRLQKYMEYRSS